MPVTVNLSPKAIVIDGIQITEWAHVRWVERVIRQNAEAIFGPENVPAKQSATQQSATVLKLVKDDAGSNS